MNTLYNYLWRHDIVMTADSGKEISRPIGILYTHTGIILGIHRWTNQVMVFHNHDESGPAIVTLREFNAGQQSHFTNRASHDPETVLLRSFQQLDKGNSYGLVDYNCHHASSYSRTGVPHSHGLQNTLLTAGAIFFFAWLNSDEDDRRKD